MIWSVEDNYVVPVSFELSYSGGYSCQSLKIAVFTSLKKKEYENKTYLIAGKRVMYFKDEAHFTAPLGAIVRVVALYGSRRRVHDEYAAWFVVECDETVEEETGEFRVRAENLRKLEAPTKEQLIKAEAEIVNSGMIPSRYDPVRPLYVLARRLGKITATAATAPTDLATRIVLELLRRKPEVIAELGFDVEEVRKAIGSVNPRVRALKKAMEVEACRSC